MQFIENLLFGLNAVIFLLKIKRVMKTILVPTDFSKAAENAANYAIELGHFCKDTKVILLHTFCLQPYLTDVPLSSIDIDDMEIKRMKQLKNFEKRLNKKSKDITIELLVETGFVVDEILRIPREQKIDLLIMGTGAASSSGNINPTNIASVIKSVKEPVLVIPEGVTFKKMERIAFACDHKQILPEDVIEKIRSHVKLFSAKLLVFEVLKKDTSTSIEKEITEIKLENALSGINHSTFFPSDDNLQVGITNFIKTNDADMLVMVPHNYPFIKGLFHRSNTNKMLHQSEVPLLSIHE